MGGSEECQLLTFASNSMRMSACVRAKASNKSITRTPFPWNTATVQQGKEGWMGREATSTISHQQAPYPGGEVMHVPNTPNQMPLHINQWLKGILRTDNRISPLLRPLARPHQSRPSHPPAPTRQVSVWIGRNSCSAAGWPPTPPVQQAVSSLADQAGWPRRGSARRRPSVGCDP